MKPDVALSETVLPLQLFAAPVMLTAGALFTVTATGADVETQPFASVTVTPYEPLALTVIEGVVSPFGDQTYELPALAVRVTLPPVQNVVGPDVAIIAAAALFTVTVWDVVEVHPPASVAVTV